MQENTAVAKPQNAGLSKISDPMKDQIVQYVATIGKVQIGTEDDVAKFQAIEKEAKRRIAAVDALLEEERIKRYDRLQEVYDLKILIKKPLEAMAKEIIAQIKAFRLDQAKKEQEERARKKQEEDEAAELLRKQNQGAAADVMNKMSAGVTGGEDAILEAAAKLEAAGDTKGAEMVVNAAIGAVAQVKEAPKTRLNQRKYGLKKFARVVDVQKFLTAVVNKEVPIECVTINLPMLHDRVRDGKVDPGIEVFEA